MRLLDEGDGNPARAGFERHANGEAIVDLVARGRRVVARGADVAIAAERGQVHPLAVDADLELMRELEPAHRPEVGAEQLHLEGVLAVERDVARNLEPAHRPERQPFDVPRLRRVLAHAIDLAHRRRLRVADRERADAAGCREIALEQHGRQAQHIGDVVEAGARIIGRQQRSRVDLEGQQVADGVGVLGAVQTMDQRTARLGRRESRAVELRRERGEKHLLVRVRRGRHAGRRHHACAHFADDLLPRVAVGPDVGQIDLLEDQPAALRARVVTGDAVAVQHRARHGLGRRDVSRPGRILAGGFRKTERRHGQPQCGRHSQGTASVHRHCTVRPKFTLSKLQ